MGEDGRECEEGEILEDIPTIPEPYEHVAVNEPQESSEAASVEEARTRRNMKRSERRRRNKNKLKGLITKPPNVK